MRRLIPVVLFLPFLGSPDALEPSGYLQDFVKMVDDSQYFNQVEKDFARQLTEGAGTDDSILDVIMDSPLISEKQKALAREYFQTRQKPEKLRFKDPGLDRDLEVVTPRLRFRADLNLRLQNVDTARDVSNFFPLDNFDLDPGMAQILRGQVRYAPKGVENPKVFGTFDLDIQSLDREVDVVNAHFQNRDNYLEIGSFLSPSFSEFGLKNTELGGAAIHLQRRKWTVDLVRGETVEDFVSGLDGLSLGGLVIRRGVGNADQDYLGASLYDQGGTHFTGFLGQTYFMDDRLRFYTEYMKMDSGTVGGDGSAQELEMDYENPKILFLNEVQQISHRFSSPLNPEYSNFTGILSERKNREHAFTYRFDPYVTSSVIYSSRTLNPLGATNSLETLDAAWTLMTQRPDRPKYMFLIKHLEKKGEYVRKHNEKQLIALARTTFKSRDILTHVDFRRTDFTDNLTTLDSYTLNSVSVDVSRPFLGKVHVRERLTLLDQSFEDPTKDIESQLQTFEVEYRMDERNSLKGSQKYRRVARKTGTNKYKMAYGLEASRKINENLSYVLRMDAFNHNEFTRGYDANRVAVGANIKF